MTQIVKLKDVITQIRGVSYGPDDVREEMLDGYIPLLRANNIQHQITLKDCIFVKKDKVKCSQMIQKGDILICTSSGSKHLVGKAAQAFSDMNYCFGAFCKVIRPRNINACYLGHFFQSDIYRKEISSLSRGANINNIKNEDLDNILIPLPSLNAQKEIAKTLDKASELVALRKKQLDELDNLVESAFYDMFGDPVKNEKGWKKGQIADTIESVNYGTSSPASENGQYKYLRMNNITYSGYLDLRDLKYIDVESNNIEKYVVRKNDILFNRTNSKELVGKTAVFTEEEEMIAAGYIIRVRLSLAYNSYYVWGYLNCRHGKAFLRNLCKNIVGMANINAKELQSIPLLLPPLALQNKFATIVKKIEEQRTEVKKALRENEDLFQKLMQNLLNPD